MSLEKVPSFPPPLKSCLLQCPSSSLKHCWCHELMAGPESTLHPSSLVFLRGNISCNNSSLIGSISLVLSPSHVQTISSSGRYIIIHFSEAAAVNTACPQQFQLLVWQQHHHTGSHKAPAPDIWGEQCRDQKPWPKLIKATTSLLSNKVKDVSLWTQRFVIILALLCLYRHWLTHS